MVDRDRIVGEFLELAKRSTPSTELVVEVLRLNDQQ